VSCPAQPPAIPQTSDEFDDPRVGLQWQWHANHHDDWYSLSDRPGWLRLHVRHALNGDLFRAPNLLLQKFPAASFVAETLVDPASLGEGAFAGLIVMGREFGCVGVRRCGDELRLVLLVGSAVEQRELTSLPVESRPLGLRVQVDHDATCTFSYRSSEGSRPIESGVLRAKSGVWIGAKIGIFNIADDDNQSRGHADFEYFRFAGE